MKSPPRHADPAGPLRVVHGLLAAAGCGVFLGGYMGAVTWGIDAIGAPPAAHRTTEHAHAERVAAAVEVPTGGPERVGRDDGKNGPEPTTPSRACRCVPRQPVVSVQPPSVTTPPLTALSASVTASTTPTRARTSTAPVTTQGDPLTVSTTPAPTSTPTTTQTAPQTTTTAAGSTTDDPDETTTAISSEETQP